MGCGSVISTILECINCGTPRAIAHADNADPLLKAKLRHLKCIDCDGTEFKIKE